MPSSTLPSTTKSTIETARKPTCPPGSAAIVVTSWREKPDCVNAQASAVAMPMMSRMAPDSEALAARAEPRQDHEGDGGAPSRHQPAGQERRERDAGDQGDGDEDDARLN